MTNNILALVMIGVLLATALGSPSRGRLLAGGAIIFGITLFVAVQAAMVANFAPAIGLGAFVVVAGGLALFRRKG